MNNRNSLIILYLLILETFGDSLHSRNIDFRKFLEDERVEEKLTTLGPHTLLKKYEITRYMSNVASENCQRDLKLYKRAILNGEYWALQMLDSSSKTPTGVLNGNIIDLGTYDECIDARTEKNKATIKGRHCMYTINPTLNSHYPLPILPSLSICLPSTCSAYEVTNILNNTINNEDDLKNLGAQLAYATCTTGEFKSSAREVKIFLSIITIYISVLALCTFCDVYANKRHAGIDLNSRLWQSLAKFSILRGVKSTLSMENLKNDILPLHGVRVLTTMSLLLLHTYYLQFFNVYANPFDIAKWSMSWRSMPIFISLHMVDVFFILSAFFMAYNFFQQIEKTKQFNFLVHFFYRYLRLTLPVVVLVFFTMIIVPHMGSGPRFEHIMNIYVTGIRTKWWSFLLYINNLVDRNNHSLLQLWSVSVEMQLFWITPVILYLLSKSPKIGIAVLLLVLLAFQVLTASIVRTNRYTSIYVSLEFDFFKLVNSINNVYLLPYSRASSWLLGILLGYIVTRRNYKPSKIIIYTGWTLAILTIIMFAHFQKKLIDINYEYDLNVETINAAISKPIWSLIICWVIYASISSPGGVVSTFLSAKIFLPLSRISYCTNITHLVFIVLQIASKKSSTYFSEYDLFQTFISNLVLFFTFGFIYSVLFEVPMLTLNNMLFKKKTRFLRKEKKLK